MNAADWQSVKARLEEALALSRSERAAWLARLAAEAPALGAEVASLLAYHDEHADETPPPLAQAAAVLLEGESQTLVGTRVGPYRVERELGHGGMGTVYLATRADGAFRQQVALKVIHLGMDTEQVLARFRRERQILATLEHPYIARLLDGGTTADGRPYLAMEHVEGERIDRYADGARLTTTERLALFLKVAEAVQYAHQRLVVHRDLKPTNILVTPDGTPKLLDFGIAKLMGGDQTEEPAAATMSMVRVMTPEYASPEQVRGEAVTTATDVYALGLLLYELLTGRRPYGTAGQSEAAWARAVCETEPMRPSTAVAQAGEAAAVRDGDVVRLRRRLRGDLDTIVLKALRKEPARRYGSVEQLADDVRRHMAGLPVEARPDTWTYRTGKFVGRHRFSVAAVILLLATLAGGIVSTVWQARRAERRFNDVRRLTNSFMFEFHDAIEALPGAMHARRLVVTRALEYLDSLVQEAGNDRSLLRELATAYERVGRIQGNSYYSNLGDAEGGMQSSRRSLEIRERLAAELPGDEALQSELADGYEGVGDMLYTIGDLPAGLQSYERALAIRRTLVTAHPAEPDHRRALARQYAKVGDIKGMEGYLNLGDTAGALESYHRAIALREELLAAEPDNDALREDLANALIFAGMLQGTTGDVSRAIESGRRAVGLLEALAASNPDNFNYSIELLLAHNVLRRALVDDGQLAEAVENTRRTVAKLKAMVANDPENMQIRRNLGVSHNALGQTLVLMGDLAGALDNHRQALAISEAIFATDPASADKRRDVGFTLERMAVVQLAAGDHRAALENYRKAIAGHEAVVATHSMNSQVRDDLSSCYAGLGNTLAALGDTAAALRAFDKAIPLAVAASASSPDNVRLRQRLGRYHFEHGKVYARVAESARPGSEREASWRAARESHQRSLDIWNELRRAGTMSWAEAGLPDEVARELARCDAALAKLRREKKS